MTLESILDRLQRKNIRATYGAVAGVLGGSAQGVMTGRAVSQRNSWIVNAETGLPTGYQQGQMHPNLRRLPIVLKTGPKLQQFLDRHLDNGN